MTLVNGTSKGLFPSHNPHDNVFTSQYFTNNLSHFLIFFRFIFVRKRSTRGAFFLCGLATRPIEYSLTARSWTPGFPLVLGKTAGLALGHTKKRGSYLRHRT